MNSFASKTGGGLAFSAALTSLTLALFVPYGHPWASLAWAVVACAVAVWVVQTSRTPIPHMGDVIRGIESESPRRNAGIDSSRRQW